MVEESDNGKFLRTVVRKDVYDRLEEFAKQYATGMNKWDFGVAIQLLLDFYEQNSSITQVNAKLDYLLSRSVEEPKEEEEEDTGTEMLGGERIK